MTTENPRNWQRLRNNLAKYALDEWAQCGYDEALFPDPLDPLVAQIDEEDRERAVTRARLNPFQRMAYSSGRLRRLELRGLYMHEEQRVFDVESSPCAHGWTRHPIRLVTEAERDEWSQIDEDPYGYIKVLGGYRSVYLGDTSDGRILQYVNDVAVMGLGSVNGRPPRYGIAERLALHEITSEGTQVSTFFDTWDQMPDGFFHTSPEEAFAAALKWSFDDWRDTMIETPDERVLRSDSTDK